MKNISEDDLILYIYRELEAEEMSYIDHQLNKDKKLKQQYDDLSKVLIVAEHWQPLEKESHFEQQLWQKITPELNKIDSQHKSVAHHQKSYGKQFFNWLLDVSLHPAPALAMVIFLVAIAYFTGRNDLKQEFNEHPEEMIASLSAEARNKILFQSVESHLEKSSRFLTSVSLTSANSSVMKSEQIWAKQLLNSNRLFTKAAEQSGQWRIVALLNELEPILIEMATSEVDTLMSRQQIQQRIENNKLVFKTKAFKTEPINSI